MNQEDARVGDLEHPLGPCLVAVTGASEGQRAERAGTGGDFNFRRGATRGRQDVEEENDEQPALTHER